VGFVNFVDGVSQLATAPVLKAVNLATVGFDGRGVTLNHRWNLFALVWMDQKHDFVMTHL